jgi:hypothetical protein
MDHKTPPGFLGQRLDDVMRHPYADRLTERARLKRLAKCW